MVTEKLGRAQWIRTPGRSGMAPSGLFFPSRLIAAKTGSRRRACIAVVKWRKGGRNSPGWSSRGASSVRSEAEGLGNGIVWPVRKFLS